ncbi:globin-coupled sensor protein [Oryzibacter oryziterrae]|uniref:globin-coupled sensor protein n=1 Tax=Oryzibacter oryziterrae TaxID=2766474 RepID=UPI001F2665B9|nr:globin-coupled sensor protein [Oryzibacter oryziterrae]
MAATPQRFYASTANELAFFQIGPAVTATLRENKAYIMGVLPEALEAFYAHVAGVEQTRRFFHSAEHIAHAKAAQLKHWGVITDGKFDESYIASVTRIGEAHNRIGLEPSWYIGGYSFLLSALIGRINKDFAGSLFDRSGAADKRTTLMQALSQAILLDMNFAIGVYFEASRRAGQQARNELAQTFEASIGVITERVVSSAGVMTRLAADLSVANRTAHEKADSVTHGSEEASSNVQAVAAATEELTSSIGEISRQAASAAQAAGSAAADVRKTAARIGELSHAAQKIGDVVELINNIAGQTNLLALNATIEAARAGEAGKGFAVVAAEVKQLADQTAKATSTIGQQISDIQNSTQGSVQAVNEISKVIENLTEIAGTISFSVDQQGTATREISANVQLAAQGTSLVARDIVEVTEANESAATATADLSASAGSLNEICRTLKSEVANFLNSVRAA